MDQFHPELKTADGGYLWHIVGVGAYTSALLALRWHVTPWLGMIAGAITAAVVAYVLSFVALRLRENLLALATLALGIVIYVVFSEWELVGGSSGLKDIPPFAIGGYAFDLRADAILAAAERLTPEQLKTLVDALPALEALAPRVE